MTGLHFDRIRPETFFVIFASIFGLMLLILTPPFQSPDEINHFYRAWQVSEGNFMAVRQNNRLGGYIPASLVKITEPFVDLIGNMHAKTNRKIICEPFNIKLNREEKRFVDFPNTAMYSPVSYFPQATALFVLRNLNLPPLFLFYGARLFALIFWIIILFFTIRTIPFYQWFFVLAALLPMSVFINMSLSADVVTNSLSFFTIAFVLKIAFSDLEFTGKKFIILALLTVLLAAAKLIYTPLIMLVFLIPKRKFPGVKTYYIRLIILFLVASGTALFWSVRMNSVYLPYSMYNVEFRDVATMTRGADMHAQAHYIMTHGLHLWHVFVNSMIRTFDMYFQGCIGVFGWLDTQLPMWFIYVSYSVLFIVAVTDGRRFIKIKLNQRLVLFLVLTVIIGLILLSQHLTWDAVGCDTTYTIQGRYFIPVFPLLFILFYNPALNNLKIVVPLVMLFSMIGLTLTTRTIYIRYYIPSEFESVTIFCNAEKVTGDNCFETNVPAVYLGNSYTRSGEKAREGGFSAKLTPKSQYAFTYRLFNCCRGDILDVGVWRYGTAGCIVISGGEDTFYSGKSEPEGKDSSGWEHIRLKFTIPVNMNKKETGIYLFYNGADSSYFDDMVITYHKLK